MYVDELRNSKEWEDFLKANSGSFYHSLMWRDVLRKSFSAIPAYFVIKYEDERLVGICPTCVTSIGHRRLLISLPFSDFGGPIVMETQIEAASVSLREFIVQYCREKDISCAKICFSKDKSVGFFKSSRSYSDYSTGVVSLNLSSRPSTFIWEKIFRKKQRKKIRSLERHGFHARLASTRSDLRDFLACYNQSMKHIGAEAYRPNFFENVWSMLHPEHFHILILESRDVAGGLGFYTYCDSIYLTYLGIDRTLLSTLGRAYSVAPFLYWESIKWAEENGYNQVWFGSTPTFPKTESEKANYSQKVIFGGSFQLQETVSIPFTVGALAILMLRAGLMEQWKALKPMMPSKLLNTIRNRFNIL
jgi:hypothetical protein